VARVCNEMRGMKSKKTNSPLISGVNKRSYFPSHTGLLLPLSLVRKKAKSKAFMTQEGCVKSEWFSDEPALLKRCVYG